MHEDDDVEPYPVRSLQAAMRESAAWGAQRLLAKGDLTDEGVEEQFEWFAAIAVAQGHANNKQADPVIASVAEKVEGIGLERGRAGRHPLTPHARRPGPSSVRGVAASYVLGWRHIASERRSELRSAATLGPALGQVRER